MPYYLLLALLMLLLKLAFTAASNNQLLFLIKPTATLVEWLTGAQATYNPSTGFFYAQLNIFIGKSCSGFNFLMMCFVLLVVSMLKYCKTHATKCLLFPSMLVLAYLLSIIANTSRIMLSIIGQQIGNLVLPTRPHLFLHDTIGTITELLFLVAIYWIIQHINTKLFSENEKLA